MKAIFEEILRDGFLVIQRLIAEQQQEGVSLDFKEKGDRSHGRLTREDRQTLAENLSAFANSAGGLLIFGVEARKNSDGVDAASAIRPIQELARFQTEITHACGELLLPRHDGIEVLPVLDPSAPNSGCLAIWIERSERRPHQSQAAKDRRYYKRAGDSTFIMEHYDIEDAFNRIAPVDLELVVGSPTKSEPHRPDQWTKRVRYVLDFSLRNSSVLSACAPYVWIDGVIGAGVTVVPAISPVLARGQFGSRTLYQADAATFVHPGLDVPAFRMDFNFDFHLGTSKGYIGNDPLETARIGVVGGMGCQNARAKVVSFEWSEHELRTLLGLR